MMDRRHEASVRAASILSYLLLAASAIAATPTTAADFRAVTQSVGTYFASLPDYQAGDLLSQSSIEGALRAVEAGGWNVPHARELVERGLPENSFLIRELSSPAGKKFMRRIARQPGAYARLDRLSTISGGQTVIRDLIRKPGGDELVKYLASTKGGQNLGKKLAGARDGVDLNKPTGRIYTADDLLAELQRTYQNNPH
jgi:hypothetical protein